MKMKILKLLSALVILLASSSSWAFNVGDVVSFDAGEIGCTIPDAQLCESHPEWFQGVVEGSYYAMDLNGNGQFEIAERIAIAAGPDGGIIMGQTQPASSGQGCQNGVGSIDEPWCFFGNTGAHQTTTYPVVDNGNGTMDFRGWGVTWAGIIDIPLGGAAWAGDTGLATLTCSSDPCGPDDVYSIEYEATVSDGGFAGVSYQLHLEHKIIIPLVKVYVTINGGSVQECAAINGHDVTASAAITLLNGAVLESITWSVDGINAGTGENLSSFLTLGNHTISVTAKATSGAQDIATASVNIVDTTAPIISAAFIDSRSGSEITSIDTKNTSFVGVSINATDICDASPINQGIGGFVLSDGDVLKVQGNQDKVELTTSVLEMQAKSFDASGNVSIQSKTLSITP